MALNLRTAVQKILGAGEKSFPRPGGEEGYLLSISLLYVWFSSMVAHKFLHLNYSPGAVHLISVLFLSEIVIFRYLLANRLKGIMLSLVPYGIEPLLVVLFIYITGGFSSLFLPLGGIYLLLVYQFAARKPFILAIAIFLLSSLFFELLETFKWIPSVQPFLGEKGARFIAAYYQATFMILGILFLFGWGYSRYFKKPSDADPAIPVQPGRPSAVWAEAEQVLSHRELEVVKAVFSGMTNKEIAEQFVIQEDTVKSHLNRVYKKLKIKNRVQLIKYFSEPSVLLNEKNEEL